MNEYKPKSGIYELLSLLFLPLIIGSFIDVSFTQLIGSQHCSFTETEFVCTIAGTTMPAWIRELVRFLIQIVVLSLLFLFIKPYIHGDLTFIGVIGCGGFMMTQSGLFEDFRRFINSIIFLAKYHK